MWYLLISRRLATTYNQQSFLVKCRNMKTQKLLKCRVKETANLRSLICSSILVVNQTRAYCLDVFYNGKHKKLQGEEDELFVEEDLKIYEESQEHDYIKNQLENVQKLSRTQSCVKEVVAVLSQERADNIQVVCCNRPHSPYQTLIIATPYNERHGNALIETVRRHFCKHYDFGVNNPQKRVQSNGWYILDLQNIVVQIMRADLREKYDLAKIWSVEETDQDEHWMPLDQTLNTSSSN